MPTLSDKYRIEPNKAQAGALGDMLRDFCGLYNAGLQQRIEAYQRRGISVNYAMQADELKAVRLAAPELARWSYSAYRDLRQPQTAILSAAHRRALSEPGDDTSGTTRCDASAKRPLRCSATQT
jgi:putative transposase